MFEKIKHEITHLFDEDNGFIVQGINQKKRLIFSLVFMFVASILVGVIVFVAKYLLPDIFSAQEYTMSLTVALAAFVGAVILYLISFHLPQWVVGFVFVFLLDIGVFYSDKLEELVHGRGLLFWAIPTMLASVLIHPAAGLGVALGNTILLAIVQVFILKESSYNAIAPIGFFLVAAIIWLSTRGYERAIQSLSKSNQELKEADLRDKERVKTLQQLSRRLMQAQEEERRRISRELHDDAGNALAQLKHEIAGALQSLPKNSSTSREMMAQALVDVESTMSRIRNISHNMRPPALDVAGLNVSFTSYCREFTEKTGFPVEYRGTDLPVLPEEISIGLYRIMQEALTNILKHAQASRAVISLGLDQHDLVFDLCDDGAGFDPDSVKKGIGLLGMEERVAFLGGRFQLDARPGNGTRLNVRLPLPDHVFEQTSIL